MRTPTQPFGKNGHDSFFPLTRRRFLKTAGVTAGALAMGVSASDAKRRPSSPPPNRSGIRHFVVVTMENRSFDHFLGWLPGADGRQAGLTYLDRTGVPHSTYALTGDYQGCAHPDPDHSYEGGRVEYNNGACDGWLQAGENDEFAIGYYPSGDLPFYASAAPGWTTCDRYFSALMAETWPNKIYQHAAQTDRLDNTIDLCTLPTIWDRLADHSLQGRYYFSDVPFIALWGTKYLPITRHISQFFADCAGGTLPHVSFVDPRFLGEDIGITNDDHPHADIRNGQAFLNSIYHAVTTSPHWANTVLVINYDEWGGFFEHVPPPVAPIPAADAAAGATDGLRGFRVPCLVIAPWSRRGFVPHGIYDHTSVLRMIEWRWNLRPLTVRDAQANNLIEVLDFTRPNLDAPQYSVPVGPHGAPCPLNVEADKWTNLATVALDFGFQIQLP